MKDREMDELLDAAAKKQRPSEPLALDAIADSLKPSMKPVRPLPATWLLTGILLLICFADAISGAARAGFFGVEKMNGPERALIFSALTILTWLAARVFIGEMIPGSRRLIPSGTILPLASAVLLGVFALMFRDYATDDFVSAGIVCLLTGLLFALPASLAGWLLLRRGFAVNSVAAGLAAGTLGGLAGVIMLELHCPNFQAAHILVWHTAVLPVGGLVGALLAWSLRSRLRA